MSEVQAEALADAEQTIDLHAALVGAVMLEALDEIPRRVELASLPEATVTRLPRCLDPSRQSGRIGLRVCITGLNKSTLEFVAVDNDDNWVSGNVEPDLRPGYQTVTFVLGDPLGSYCWWTGEQLTDPPAAEIVELTEYIRGLERDSGLALQPGH